MSFKCDKCNLSFKNKHHLSIHTNVNILSDNLLEKVISGKIHWTVCHGLKFNKYLQNRILTLNLKNNSLKTLYDTNAHEQTIIKDMSKKIIMYTNWLKSSEIKMEHHIKNTIVHNSTSPLMKLSTDVNEKFVYSGDDDDFEDLLEINKYKSSQWVYFIHSNHPSSDVKHSMVKIGLTKCMINRLKELQTGSPYKLKIIGYIETDNMNVLEKEFHNYLSECRNEGEWFNLSKGDVYSILDNYRVEGVL